MMCECDSERCVIKFIQFICTGVVMVLLLLCKINNRVGCYVAENELICTFLWF